MYIALSPVRSDIVRTLIRRGDTLIVNGEPFDFTALQEGDILPLDAVEGNWLGSAIERRGGDLHLTVILPHGVNAPAETLFPAPLHLTEDGPVDLPPYGDQK